MFVNSSVVNGGQIINTVFIFFHVTLLDLCTEVCLPSHNNHKHLHLCKHMQSVFKTSKMFSAGSKADEVKKINCPALTRCVFTLFCITVILPCGSLGQLTAYRLICSPVGILMLKTIKYPCHSKALRFSSAMGLLSVWLFLFIYFFNNCLLHLKRSVWSNHLKYLVGGKVAFNEL